MARILPPNKDLWEWKPDERVIQSAPRQDGVSARDVLEWGKLLAAGADMIGPVAGRLFSGQRSAPETTKTQVTRKVPLTSGDTAAVMGAGQAAGVDLGGAGITGTNTYTHETGDFRQLGSNDLMNAATKAAVSGDRSRAMAVLDDASSADYGDVVAGGLRDLVTGDHKVRRQNQIRKMIMAGKYRDPIQEQRESALYNERLKGMESSRRLADTRRSTAVNKDRREESYAPERIMLTMQRQKNIQARTATIEEKLKEYKKLSPWRLRKTHAEAVLKEIEVQIKEFEAAVQPDEHASTVALRNERIAHLKRMYRIQLARLNESRLKRRDTNRRHRETLRDKPTEDEKRAREASKRAEKAGEEAEGAAAAAKKIHSGQHEGDGLVYSKSKKGLRPARAGEKPTHYRRKDGSIVKARGGKSMAEASKKRRQLKTLEDQKRGQAFAAKRNAEGHRDRANIAKETRKMEAAERAKKEQKAASNRKRKRRRKAKKSPRLKTLRGVARNVKRMRKVKHDAKNYFKE